MEERDAWICLAAASGVGPQTFWALVAHHGGALPALRALERGPRRALPDRRVAQPAVDALAAVTRDPLAATRRSQELGLWAVTPLDSSFPARLRVLDPPPPVLFGWGDARSLQADRVVAVVGTRRPTVSGRALATRVASRLGELGAVIVSGLAVGIDGAAHAASVAAGARTVAVIGGGHARAGPRAHRALLDAVLATGGAVISEHGPDTAPTRGTFPRRNRIISALADATIVIEAPARSGALITARHALEQGRFLLVAPGRPDDPAVAGCLALLRETPARPLVGLDEMVVDLGYDEVRDAEEGAVALDQAGSGRLSADGALELLGPAERAVARRLVAGPADPDGLVADTGLAPAVVSGALTLLLLRGWAQAMGPAIMAAGPLLAADRR